MTRFDNDLCRCSRFVAKIVFVLQKEMPVTSTINIIHLYSTTVLLQIMHYLVLSTVRNQYADFFSGWQSIC